MSDMAATQGQGVEGLPGSGVAARTSIPFIARVACLTVFTLASHGGEFDSFNKGKIAHFWDAAEQGDRPVTVVSFGDSMADSYRSPSFHLMNRLTEKMGSSGYSLANYKNTALYNLANGAQALPPGAYWFNLHFSVPPTGAVWWNNQSSPGGVFCDRAGIFFVAQPEGGQFRLSISTNGGPWTTKLILDGFSETPQGRFAEVSLSADHHRLRVDGDVGINYIIGPHALMTQTGGIHAVFMDWPGIHLGQITDVPLAIREPVFRELQPDLLVWHMKEDGAAATSNRLAENEAWWRQSAPDCDVLYIGTTWVSVDLESSLTLEQNAAVRQTALQHGRAYTDLMQPTTSYSWLESNGFMADGTHLNSAGGLFCANIIWEDLGFFALGLNRQLSLSIQGSQLRLEYDASPGANYKLESSANLRTWSPVITHATDAGAFSTNFPVATVPAYFRLNLTPK